MKITISDNSEVLKTIELTTLQLKSIRLTDKKPEDYIAHKLERILEFAVNQAKQMIDRVSPLTDKEIEDIIDMDNPPEKD